MEKTKRFGMITLVLFIQLLVSVFAVAYAYLRDGNSTREGTVQVRYQTSYGTVCDDEFGSTDADVVCRMLGYTFAESYSCCAAFGEGIGEILFDGLKCTGDEVTIGHCEHNALGDHNCGHHEVAGVTCIRLPVRLVEGNAPNEGRVEVYYLDSWGTICDDSWDINDARVICRMLGYPGVSSALVRFGEATGDIILDDVDCNGSETHLAHCNHHGYGIHNCSHSEDVGVICSGEADLKIRLVDGPDESQGRLEMFYFGSWGTVCQYGWTMFDSEVVCRMLGYVGAAAYSFYSSYGRGTGEIILSEPRCSGKESSLLECNRAYDLGVTYCGHTYEIGVSCLTLDDLQVRLVNGSSDKEGRVEILYLGTWGTVCDDNWDLNDANVVCRMLGFERAESYSCCPAFGPGTGPILLDEVECEGTESNIGHCRRSDYETHNCDHSEDVGVSCIEFEVTEASSSTMTMPSGNRIGLSMAAMYGLFGFLIALVICILLVCIIVTLRMQKYSRLIKESRSKVADKISAPATENCYNGPQSDKEAYMELNIHPGSRTQGGSSSNRDGPYDTPRPVTNDDKIYENVRL
ncbi:deleted in malignant brain tumors 1 protein-like [Lytechinus variegatus]|uniref:deleted in malignant brain tumors 1 protein-like n=1 Tax=Lytechinus variegatus TaxID=7654 RepID=UPI001BB29F53|nr:deleted in malignant brain tumors 1 protein-like [Lytechinus variegatus]